MFPGPASLGSVLFVQLASGDKFVPELLEVLLFPGQPASEHHQDVHRGDPTAPTLLMSLYTQTVDLLQQQDERDADPVPVRAPMSLPCPPAPQKQRSIDSHITSAGSCQFSDSLRYRLTISLQVPLQGYCTGALGRLQQRSTGWAAPAPGMYFLSLEVAA